VKVRRSSPAQQQPVHRGSADLELLGQFLVRFAGLLPHLEDAAT
jgi:hypothetical protein